MLGSVCWGGRTSVGTGGSACAMPAVRPEELLGVEPPDLRKTKSPLPSDALGEGYDKDESLSVEAIEVERMRI